MRGHRAALPWTHAGRYAAGVDRRRRPRRRRVPVGLPLGLALGSLAIVTVLVICLGAVLAVNRALPD